MNTHVRDNLKAIGDAWTEWTPTVIQSGTCTDVTITYAKYVAAGKLITGAVKVTFTGATGAVGNNAITVSLPVTAATSGLYVGAGSFYDAGTVDVRCGVYLQSTTTIALYRADASASSPVGVDPNMTVANNDVFYASFTYEAA
jgi:hypothetical protein